MLRSEMPSVWLFTRVRNMRSTDDVVAPDEVREEPPTPRAIDQSKEGLLYWRGWLANRLRYRFRNFEIGKPTGQLE